MATTASTATAFDASSPVAQRVRAATASTSFSFTASAPVAGASRAAKAATTYSFSGGLAKSQNGDVLADDGKWRVIVQESRTKIITNYDMQVKNLIFQRSLSAGCDIEFDLDFHDQSVAGIYPKPWEQYIAIERVLQGKRRIVCMGIVQPSDIDEQTGIQHLKVKGFATYPKGLPWLQDINHPANDAFLPVHEIWDYLQSYPNGNLDVEVFPARSGAIMLPGYAYDGNTMNINFFATFVRATDKIDCGDYIDGLARDIPFDYAERHEWNADRTDIIKRIELGYPRLGVIQENLAFVINENVLSAKPHTETQNDWVSDVGITGFYPGVQYSAELANADPNRLRRYLDENDAYIDSNERAAAWGHKRLARRQTPAYWETITVSMTHPNAPFGTYDVGDTITVSGFMPWVGMISQDHKIIAIQVDTTKNAAQLTLYAEGEFNYDFIFFPNQTSNIIDNTGFDFNLEGWTASGPGWTWDGSQGNTKLGSVTITADGSDHDLLTQAYGLSDFEIFPLTVWVKCSGAVASGDAVQLVAQFYADDGVTPTEAFEVAGVSNLRGEVPWQKLTNKVIAPVGSSHVALRLHVGSEMTAGQVWFDDAVLPV